MRRFGAALFALIASATAALAQDTPRIVAVNHALAYLAGELAGDDAEVVYPVPEGTDPSFWRPGIADISAIQSADLILLSGAGFAAWTAKVSLPRSKLLDTSRGYQDRFIATESITHSHGDGGEHAHEGTAAYTWLDPTLAQMQAAAVADALTARGLVPEAEVSARLETLTATLADLEGALETLPTGANQPLIVATHPRYQYLARASGLTVTSLEWDAGAAPDADQLATLESLIAGRDAAVLIWEADPGAEARTAVRALGFADTVFPPLATPADRPFAESYRASVAGLAEALARANGN